MSWNQSQFAHLQPQISSPEPIVGLQGFSHLWHGLQIVASSSDWFNALCTCAVIGQTGLRLRSLVGVL